MVKVLPTIERSTKIRFGKYASESQGENTIVFNASNVAIDASTEGGVYIAPMRTVDPSVPEITVLSYNTVTKEIVNSNTATVDLFNSNLQFVSQRGNVTSSTLEFINPTTSFVTTGNVGIHNTHSIHTLDVGSNLFVDDKGSNILVVTGNTYTSRKALIGSNVTIDTLGSNVVEVTGNVNVTNYTKTDYITVRKDARIQGNLVVEGTTTTTDTENVTFENAVISLANNNIQSSTDIGLIMNQPNSNASPSIIFRGDENEMMVGYTLNNASDTEIVPDLANVIDLHVYGNVIVQNNLTLTSGNITTVTVNSNVFGDNVVATNTMYGNISGSNLISASNITVGNLFTNSNIYGNIAGSNLISASNITVGNLFTNSNIYGNIAGSNLISASNITVGNLFTNSNIYGNIAGSNLISASNITVGNLFTNSNIYGNIAGSNLISASNITVGNLFTNSNIYGNIAGSNLISASNVTTGILHVESNVITDNVESTTVKISGLTPGFIPIVGSDNILEDSVIEYSGDTTTISSNVEITGNLSVIGNTFTIESNSLVIDDRVLGIANNNVSHTLDVGIIMGHPDHNIAFIHHGAATEDDPHEHVMTLGYTQNTVTDNHVLDDLSNLITFEVLGNVIVQNNLTLTSGNLTAITVNSNVVGNTANVITLNSDNVVATNAIYGEISGSNAISASTISATESVTSITTSGNVVVSGNVTATKFIGDGSTLSNVQTSTPTLASVVDEGNVTTNVVRFSNTTTGIKIASNIAFDDKITLQSLTSGSKNGFFVVDTIQLDPSYASPTRNVLSYDTTTGEIYDSGGQGGSSFNNITEQDANVFIGSNLIINTYGSNVLTVSGNVSADNITIGGLNIAASPFGLDDVVSSAVGSNVTSNVLTLGGLVTNAITANNITVSENGYFTGSVTASSFSGSGASLTGLNSSNVTTGTLSTSRGGTGQSSYTTGDIIYANGSSSLTRLGIGSVGEVLTVSGGVPTWAAASGGGFSGDIADYITHTSDSDTNFGFPSNDTFTITTANTERFRIKSDGNVGIGTTNPTSKLYVSGDGYFTSSLTASYFYGDGSGIMNLNADRISTGTLSTARGGTSQYSYTTGDILYASGSSTLSKLSAGSTGYVLTSNGPNTAPTWQAASGGGGSSPWTESGSYVYYNGGGYVGIGTSSPSSALHVECKSSSSYNANGLYLKQSSSAYPTRLTIDNTSSTQKSFMTFKTGTSFGWSYGMDGLDSRKLKWSYDYNNLDSTTKMVLDEYGKLGIGTTSPSYTLHVVGDINFEGTLYQYGSPFSGGGGSSAWTTSGSNIYYNSGNVGIGTSTPGYKLHVYYNSSTSYSSPLAKFEVDQYYGAWVNIEGGDQTLLYFKNKYWNDDMIAGYTNVGYSNRGFKIAPGSNYSGNYGLFVQNNPNGYVGIGTNSPTNQLHVSGSCYIQGSLSKMSGSFKIDHPIPSMSNTHYLYHSFIEGPQADLIYRGSVDLVNGSASINLDTVSKMTDGTFEALNRNVQCFTTNETDWDAVKGSVSGNILTISCQNTSSSANVSWMIIGERKDQHMYDTEWTDEEGYIVPEQLK